MKINSSGITELANTSFTPALVESRITTDYIDWQADGAVILKNGVKLAGSGITSLKGFYYLTDAWRDYDTVVVRSTSGSFTVPAGVYSILVVLFGGGGGGGASYPVTTVTEIPGGEGGTTSTTTYQPGGSGGLGGAGFEILSVSPNDTITYTIGAGGSGGIAYRGNGSAGGNSTLTYTPFSMTVTGGGAGLGNGTSGTSGTYSANPIGQFTYSDVTGSYENQISISAANPFASQSTIKDTGGTFSTAYSLAGSFIMGARGLYGFGTTAGLRDGWGGVGGGALFFYKAPQ